MEKLLNKLEATRMSEDDREVVRAILDEHLYSEDWHAYLKETWEVVNCIAAFDDVLNIAKTLKVYLRNKIEWQNKNKNSNEKSET